MKAIKQTCVVSALGALVVSTLGMPSGSAFAQNGLKSTATSSPADSAKSGQPTSNEAVIGEIIVTATRRAQSVRRVPLSIQAFSGEALTQGGIKTIADLASVSPGLQYAEPNALPSTITTIAIRGMNSNTGPSTVGEYLDDTPLQVRLSPLTNFGNPYPGVFDLNRVEVARGPQGTLFGAGAEAGTVRFIPNEPGLRKFTGFAHAEVGIIQGGGPSFEAGVAGGGPIINDKLGFRFSAWDRHEGGYIDRLNIVTGKRAEKNANTTDKLSLRLALTYKPTDDLKISPSIFYQNGKRGDSGRFYEILSDASKGQFVGGRLLPEVSHDYLTVGSFKIEQDFSFATLTSVTSFVNRSGHVNLDQSSVPGEICLVPGFPAPVCGYGNPLGIAYPATENDVNYTLYGQNLRGFSEELRLTSSNKDAFVTWVAGVFFDRRKQTDYLTQQSFRIDPTGNLILDQRQVATDRQIAAFAQLDFHLTHALTASLGERVARVRTDLNVTNGTGILNPSIPFVKAPTANETPQTPKVILSYQYDPRNLLYASFSKGYRIGGGNPALPNICSVDLQKTQSFSSDSVLNYEVGAKNTFFDGKVQLDVSLFRANWKNIQQLIFLSCGNQYTANAGNAVVRGLEFAAHTRVTDNLTVDVNVSYSDAYFTSNVFDDKGNILVAKNDKVGQLPQVNAPWNVNLAAGYRVPFSSDHSLMLRGEYNFKSRNPGPFVTQHVTSGNYYPLITADPAINVVNLRAIYTLGKLDVGFDVQNIFNAHPLLQKFQETSNSNFINYNTLQPRTFAVSLNYQY